MNKGVNISINRSSKKAIEARFKQIGDFDKRVDHEMRKMVMNAANDAARRAPKDYGTLHTSISSGKTEKLGYYVRAQAFYAAFVEWGTRAKFHAGNLADMLSLGISASYAEQFKAVPLKKATNIVARPFFFPAVKKAVKEMKNNIERQLKLLTK